MPLLYRHLGHLLRQLRERARLTQRDIAERIGVSGAYVHHVEMGGRRADLDILERFAESVGARLVVDIVPADADADTPEARLLAAFRKLHPDAREAVLRMIEATIRPEVPRA